MSDILKRLTRSIDKVARVLHLTKMRVFYQIILIITIMAVFMVALGYMGITAMSNLQNTTQVVYDETANKLHDLSQLKVDVNEITLGYLEVALSGEAVGAKATETGGVTYSDIEDLVQKAKAKTSYLDGLRLTQIAGSLKQSVAAFNLEKKK